VKTPILRVGGNLLTSLQEDLSDEEFLAFQTDLARMVVETDASGVVIDITALDVVDSFMARVINETAHTVSLLGAIAVICGMQPAVALTLVEMGRDLIDVETTLNLDQAMEQLERRIDIRRDAAGGGEEGERVEQTYSGIASGEQGGSPAEREAA